MHYQNEALFRLRLAKGFLKEAQEDFNLSRWRSCVDNAQLCSENAGKSIVAIFKPIEKTHDPSIQLRKIVEEGIVDKNFVCDIERIIPLYAQLSSEEHFLTDYGEEETLLTPWELYSKDDAEDALSIARDCFSVAEKIYKSYFGDVV